MLVATSTVSALLREAGKQLGEAGSAAPTLEARVLLETALPATRVWLLQHPHQIVASDREDQFRILISRRLAGEPLAYVVGHREFFGLDFEVTRDTLVPRPETELLVERAAALIREKGYRRIVDVGTGTGAITISLAKTCPGPRIFATDVSRRALAVARRNAARHGVTSRVDFLCSNLLSAVVGPFDLILANLPYVPTADLDTAPADGPASPAALSYEPRLALDGGFDGLDLYRRFLLSATANLTFGGTILFEIAWDQGTLAAELAHKAALHARVTIHRDLAGHDRVVELGVVQ